MFHRASLGVTGVEAQQRFGAGASAVSLFLVLAVYAALQVPVGVVLDRLGSRRMIVAGALTMADAGRCAAAPLRRSVLVFAILGATALSWTVVLLWPGPAPLPLLVLLVMVLGTNGPGSMIGFDYARTENPVERVGSASGVVDVGGFVASLLTVLAIGAVLDLLTPGRSTDDELGAFRAAFAVQYVFWAIGLYGVVRHRRQLRARLARDGIVLAPLRIAVQARIRGGSAYR